MTAAQNPEEEKVQPSELEEEEEEVEYGGDREPGVAGPEALYVLRSVERWRLRGEGILTK
jgi:acetyl-CoA decarbonylase/synthase complex subunit delta